MEQKSYERIETEIRLTAGDMGDFDMKLNPSMEIPIRYHTPEEEIA